MSALPLPEEAMPDHPLAIVFRLFMEHVMQPALETGGVARREAEWTGCRDPHCRPFLVAQEVDSLGRPICPACPEVRSSDRALRHHMREVHGVNPPSRPRKAVGPVPCDCGAILAHRNSYIKHVNRGRCSVYHPHPVKRGRPPKWKRPGELKARR